jgi:hypothetical protein
MLNLARRHDEMTGKPSYNLACALSISGLQDEALDVLEGLQRSGALDVGADRLASDPDLAQLTSHPRFQALLTILRDPKP